VVKTTLRCNYYGTLESTETFIPLLKPHGRVVNVSSAAGSLGKYPAALQSRFRNPSSVEDITKIMEEFVSAVEAGKETEAGFPSAAYAVSKAGATGMTRIIAQETKSSGKDVLINACCPGWVKVCKFADWQEIYLTLAC